jgi:exopolysaccharide production protein ExoZ
MRRLNGLQYLRGLAATAVVAFHAAGKAGLNFHIGEAGVDLFFVLSGFLMVTISSEQTRALPFLADRLRRVAPTYWIATSVVLAGALAGAFPSIRLTGWHIAASYLFIPSISPSNGQVWPLLVPGWTLNFEMMFYLLFAACLALVPYRKRVPALTTFLAGLVLLGLLFQPTHPIAKTLTHPILLEFAAGAWLGLLWQRGGRWPSAAGWPMIVAGAALTIAAAASPDDRLRPLLFGIPATLLVAGALCLERWGGIPDWPRPRLIGDASYSIYLWHTLAISLTAKLVQPLALPPLALALLGAGMGMASGIAAYRLIELPLMRRLKRCPRRPEQALAVPA